MISTIAGISKQATKPNDAFHPPLLFKMKWSYECRELKWSVN